MVLLIVLLALFPGALAAVAMRQAGADLLLCIVTGVVVWIATAVLARIVAGGER